SEETVCNISHGLCVSPHISGSSCLQRSSAAWLHDQSRFSANSVRESTTDLPFEAFVFDFIILLQESCGDLADSKYSRAADVALLTGLQKIGFREPERQDSAFSHVSKNSVALEAESLRSAALKHPTKWH